MLLAARDLSWATPAGRPVLQQISLELEAGEVLAVCGPSGCGKSTLLRCLVWLDRPLTGEIWSAGELVGPTSIYDHRRRVRLVPQRAVGMVPEVWEDLALARSLAPDGLDEPAQRDLLGRLGLHSIEPEQRFDDLSGGEQQRVAMVRALTGRPQVLLLDEPTASLDVASAEGVWELLSGWLAAGPDRGIVLVSHDPVQRSRLATRALVVGQKSCDRPPERAS